MVRKQLHSALGLGVACLICCAPLWLPWLAGAGAALSAGGGLLVGGFTMAVVFGAIGAGLVGGLSLWGARRRRLQRPEPHGCGDA